jgi:hypothetical protein
MKSFILIALSIMAIQTQAHIEVKAVGQNSVQTTDQTPNAGQQRLSHFFGIVGLNSYNYVDFVVTNRGQTFLGYEAAFISGMDYRARTNCNSGLAPGQQCQFTITYNPMFEGVHSGLFELYFSEDNAIIVDTWGEARRW